MGNGPRDSARKPPGYRRVMVYSLFVVPGLIAALCVGIFAGVYVLVMDKPDVLSLVDDVRHGYQNKRWRSAYHLVAVLEQRPESTLRPEESRALQDAFEASVTDSDVTVRQYLALALGCAGDRGAVPILLRALETDAEGTIPFLIKALGRLGDPRAASAIVPYLKSDKAPIRLESVIALGHIAAPETRDALQNALADPEPNVAWDAGIALAKMGDARGEPVLRNLLTPAYLEGFENVDAREAAHVRVVAIRAASQLNSDVLNRLIKKLAETDPSDTVRQTARQALQRQRSGEGGAGTTTREPGVEATQHG